jgi:hypothetical protein
MGFGFWDRFGTLAIAAALLFAALRFHRSPRRWAKVVGVVGSFLAGCALLVTFAGGWMGSLAGRGAGAFFVAGLIVCAVIIAVDVGVDKKPDKPAFWAAYALAAVVVFGVASVPKVTGQVGDGANRVGSSVQQIGK